MSQQVMNLLMSGFVCVVTCALTLWGFKRQDGKDRKEEHTELTSLIKEIGEKQTTYQVDATAASTEYQIQTTKKLTDHETLVQKDLGKMEVRLTDKIINGDQPLQAAIHKVELNVAKINVTL